MNTFLKNKMPPLAQETENFNKTNKLKWYKNIPSKKKEKSLKPGWIYKYILTKLL